MTKKLNHLTKSQKTSLGVLSFVVLVLPLSLIFIKTKTNLLPKATFPATPPVTSPVPSSTPWPSATASAYPSPSILPSPIPSASPSASISLAGDTLPDDPRINFQTLIPNEKLLPSQPNIFTYVANLNNQDLVIEDSYGEPGYGEFFIFYPEPGMKFEILAKELDIQSVGSYIETAFYGPDKNKIIKAGTRIQHSAPSRLPYYLAVYTFDHKQGRAEITVSNVDRIHNKPYVKRIDQDMKPLINGSRLGRKAVDFFLQVPLIENINNEYITYTSQADNVLTTNIPRVKMTQTCPLTNQSKPMTVGIRKFNNPNSEPLREIQMKIYPQTAGVPDGGAYYPPGYNYTVNLEYPNPNRSWTTRFSTTSQSGVAADLNDDGAVDISDYSLLISELMQSNNFLVSDLNCDGIVDISDYSLLISNISL